MPKIRLTHSVSRQAYPPNKFRPQENIFARKSNVSKTMSQSTNSISNQSFIASIKRISMLSYQQKENNTTHIPSNIKRVNEFELKETGKIDSKRLITGPISMNLLPLPPKGNIEKDCSVAEEFVSDEEHIGATLAHKGIKQFYKFHISKPDSTLKTINRERSKSTLVTLQGVKDNVRERIETTEEESFSLTDRRTPLTKPIKRFPCHFKVHLMVPSTEREHANSTALCNSMLFKIQGRNSAIGSQFFSLSNSSINATSHKELEMRFGLRLYKNTRKFKNTDQPEPKNPDGKLEIEDYSSCSESIHDESHRKPIKFN